MKYWRGYLVAAIVAAITVGLIQLAERFTALVDMFYPYLTRTMQNFLAEWSGAVSVNLWQVLAIAAVLLLVVTIVLMILLRWNFIQWLGWVLAVCSLVWLLNTGVYGLNTYSGPLADDLRLDMAEFSIDELEEATIYFRDQANELALQMPRDSESNLLYDDFATLANQAGSGFENLVRDEYYSVFAGTLQPVKELGWADGFRSMGISSVFVPITGEAAVNPHLPAVALPFTMCREMARRMGVAAEDDANFAAVLACMANEDLQFRYSAYFMAYRYCCEALTLSGIPEGAAAAARIKTEVNTYLHYDLKTYEKYFSTGLNEDAVDLTQSLTDRLAISNHGDDRFGDGREAAMLANWYIQEYILPYLDQEDVTGFDPMDEDQVDISDIYQ